MKKLAYVSFNRRSLAIEFINSSINEKDLFTICEDETSVIVYYWVYK